MLDIDAAMRWALRENKTGVVTTSRYLCLAAGRCTFLEGDSWMQLWEPLGTMGQQWKMKPHHPVVLYQPVRAEWDGFGGYIRNIMLASAVTLSSEPAREDNKEQFHNSAQIMERDSLWKLTWTFERLGTVLFLVTNCSLKLMSKELVPSKDLARCTLLNGKDNMWL